MSRPVSNVLRSLLHLVAIALLLAMTWLCFAPIASFHHQVAYGLLFYMFSGSEDADPGDFVILGERFWFFPVRFVATLGVWLVLAIGIIALWKVCRQRLA